MRKVFEIEAASADGCTQLTLPAGPYALLDALYREGLLPRTILYSLNPAGRAGKAAAGARRDAQMGASQRV